MQKDFNHLLRSNWYPQHLIIKTDASSTSASQLPPAQQSANTNWLYLNTPFLSEKFDYKIKNISKQEGFNVRTVHKSHNPLRQTLKSKRTRETCKLKNCIMSNNNCYQQVMHIKGHLPQMSLCLHWQCNIYVSYMIKLMNTSSVVTHPIYKHLVACNNNKNNLQVDIIDREEPDPVNIRLLEAIYIKKNRPSTSSREESNDMNHLLF